MAYAPSTTLARVNPAWVPPVEIYEPLTRFFGGRGAAPIINQPAPKRPAPAMEMA